MNHFKIFQEAELPNGLLQAMLIVRNHDKHNCMLVGGCVRDTLLGKTPKDYDLVTKANLVPLKEEFIHNGWSVKDVGDAFLVTSVSKYVGELHYSFEIARYRSESSESDGRRPNSVAIGTPEEDADRRDFTMNAIYWNPLDKNYWDRHNGIKDIDARVIRFIGNPKDRIREDYLRIFRAYRFASTLGFTMDKRTLKACREMFTEAYKNTTPERVRMELERMI